MLYPYIVTISVYNPYIEDWDDEELFCVLYASSEEDAIWRAGLDRLPYWKEATAHIAVGQYVPYIRAVV